MSLLSDPVCLSSSLRFFSQRLDRDSGLFVVPVCGLWTGFSWEGIDGVGRSARARFGERSSSEACFRFCALVCGGVITFLESLDGLELAATAMEGDCRD